MLNVVCIYIFFLETNIENSLKEPSTGFIWSVRNLNWTR